MTRGRLGALAVVAAGLILTIGLELGSGTVEEDGMLLAPPRAGLPATPQAAGRALASQSQTWASTVLARPLFAPGRRPAAAQATAAAALPRVTGIVMDGSVRRVIFAAAGSGKPLVVSEGGEVSGFRVQSIERGQVTIVGAGGAQVLRPSFDPAPPPAAAAVPAGMPPGQAAILGLPVTGAQTGPAAR